MDSILFTIRERTKAKRQWADREFKKCPQEFDNDESREQHDHIWDVRQLTSDLTYLIGKLDRFHKCTYKALEWLYDHRKEMSPKMQKHLEKLSDGIFNLRYEYPDKSKKKGTNNDKENR